MLQTDSLSYSEKVRVCVCMGGGGGVGWGEYVQRACSLVVSDFCSAIKDSRLEYGC